MKWIFSLNKALSKIENILLVLMLLLMIVLYSLQTILRNFFSTAILWIDPFVYNLLLWIALIGASLATINKKDISIDITTKLLPKKIVSKTIVITNIAASMISWFLASASVDYIIAMREDGLLESDYLPIPLWITKIILPIGFYIISFRFSLRALENVLNIFGIYVNNNKPEKSPSSKEGIK